MDYRIFGSHIVVRVDRGEEIVSALTDLSRKEGIVLGSVNGLGAVSEAVFGLYRVKERAFLQNERRGEFELAALTGSITQKDGEPYLHLHAVFADETGQTFGGHLSRAVVSGTAEIFVDLLPGRVGRKKDEAVTGLNLFSFSD